MKKKFEYSRCLITKQHSILRLNELGNDGWELVAMIDEDKKRYMGFFKREKSGK